MLVLIAHDLTGSSDAGVQFAQHGLTTRVTFDFDARSIDSEPVEVLAVDTDTRALPPRQAYERVRTVADALRRLQPRYVYKKIDSTLRGNLGAEIDALIDAFDLRLALVAPALPMLGRTTRGGIHYAHGTPVHLSEAGRDPRSPVTESSLVHLLRTQSRRSVNRVQGEYTSIAGCAEALVRQGVELLVVDAESDADLRATVEVFADWSGVLWVGSAGLAEHLASRIGSLQHAIPQPVCAVGQVIIVSGSASETTRRQVRELCARCDVLHVEIKAAERAEIERCQDLISNALADGGDCVLTVARTDVVGMPESIADVLGAIVADAVRAHAVGGLVMTGGDTARAVCRALGATGLQVIGEVETGMPLGLLVGAIDMLVITKAGAFGSELALVHAVERLKGAQVR